MWRRIVRAWNKRGPLGFARLAIENVNYFARLPFQPKIVRGQRFDRRFDHEHGTDTTGYVPIGALSVPPENEEHAREYAPSDTETVRAILAKLDIDHRKFAFIDFGSGKGRAILLASDYPFERIIGVEFAPVLHQIAVRNIAIYKSTAQRCKRLESVCADATSFEFPDCCVVCFFNNPFDEIVFGKWLANFERWSARNTHDAYVVYLNCFHRHLFDRSSEWRLLAEGGSTDTSDGFAIYRYIR